MIEQIETRFREVIPKADYCSLRYVRERSEAIPVRQNVVEPVSRGQDAGAMITVIDGDGLGYAATSDLTTGGLRRAAAKALEWARATAGRCVADFSKVPRTSRQAEYQAPVGKAWESLSLKDKIDLLRRECERLKTDDRIVDWMTALVYEETDTLLLTSEGGRIRQQFRCLVPVMRATANQGPETQTRTLGGDALTRQAGLELLDDVGFFEAAPRVAGQAIELLTAPDCPSGSRDLLAAPDQMILQIHESIGHPLELDRILGDERNYAGTSFVTVDMLGTYPYGSELLNITYDPTRPEQLASYAFDDDGTPATKEYIIKDGILQRALGGIASQTRTGKPGVANARASSWNRPPIDRMANLNLEPGGSTFDDMVGQVERGVYMETNRSWSIDDSRNKFQFGCEWARLIDSGELTTVVKNPNYRGISATFWRSLKAVGNEETFVVMGTPNCGKGEPNQLIKVGHASPAALFADVDVFGGA
ncbi:MAG: TldD/PmbA family protein [Phycisphaerae bacterium]|nr:TldD/PmbA family protein [Phycisphaerae bacterium]